MTTADDVRRHLAGDHTNCQHGWCYATPKPEAVTITDETVTSDTKPDRGEYEDVTGPMDGYSTPKPLPQDDDWWQENPR